VRVSKSRDASNSTKLRAAFIGPMV